MTHKLYIMTLKNYSSTLENSAWAGEELSRMEFDGGEWSLWERINKLAKTETGGDRKGRNWVGLSCDCSALSQNAQGRCSLEVAGSQSTPDIPTVSYRYELPMSMAILASGSHWVHTLSFSWKHFPNNLNFSLGGDPEITLYINPIFLFVTCPLRNNFLFQVFTDCYHSFQPNKTTCDVLIHGYQPPTPTSD